jgi:hypothetical protein
VHRTVTYRQRYCDISTPKIHISNNFILSISLLIKFDTLLLRPSLHRNTPLHFTTLHPTTLQYTSLHFTHLHFTTLIDTSLPLIYTSLPFYLALCIYVSYSISLHITSTDLIPKIISKKVNPFTALKNFSPLHFTFYFIYLFIYLFIYYLKKSNKMSATPEFELLIFLV